MKNKNKTNKKQEDDKRKKKMKRENARRKSEKDQGIEASMIKSENRRRCLYVFF